MSTLGIAIRVSILLESYCNQGLPWDAGGVEFSSFNSPRVLLQPDNEVVRFATEGFNSPRVLLQPIVVPRSTS